MGLFKKRADPAELAQLKSELAAMSARLDHADAAKEQLGEQVQGIVSRLDTPIAAPPETPPPLPEPAIDPAELDVLRARIQRLGDRMDEIDQRVTSIATELANQISEISSDIETLGGEQPPAGVSDELVGELRDAQTRLANEQARYQIAFRQDLAELAERLKRA